MKRKLFSIILVFLALTIFVGAILVVNFQRAEKEEIEINVCTHLLDFDSQTISYLVDLRVSWVRTDWVTNSTLMSAYSQDLENHGIKLLAILNMSTFPVQDNMLGEWNATLEEIVHSQGFNNTDAVEICNEPNGEAFFPPDTYSQMLKSAYTIIKNHFAIPVVFAGLSPDSTAHNYTWKTYLNAVFDAHNDTQDYFDYIGAHVYHSISRDLETIQFVKNLTNKPIWITEAGETSTECCEKAQANYLESVYSDLEPQVNKIFVYELKNKALSDYREDNFGLLTVNNTKKQAYFAIKNTGKK